MRVTFESLQYLFDTFHREVARFDPGSTHDLDEVAARHFVRHGLAVLAKPEAPAGLGPSSPPPPEDDAEPAAGDLYDAPVADPEPLPRGAGKGKKKGRR